MSEARVKELEDELKAAKLMINLLNETVRNLTGLLNSKIEENRQQTGMEKKLDEFMERMEKKQDEMKNLLLDAESQTTLTQEEKTIKEKTQNETNELRRKIDASMTVDDECQVKKRMRKEDQVTTEYVEEPTVNEKISAKVVVPREAKENDSGYDNKRNEMHEILREIGSDLKFIKEEKERKKIAEDEFRIKVDSLLDGDLEVLKKRIFIKNFEIFFENGVSFHFNDFENLIREFQNSPNAGFEYGLKVLQNPLWIMTPENYEVECWNPKCRKITDLTNFRDEGLVAQCTGCYELILLGKPRPGFEWVEADQCAHILQIKKGEIPKQCETCEQEIVRVAYDWNECIRTPRRKI